MSGKICLILDGTYKKALTNRVVAPDWRGSLPAYGLWQQRDPGWETGDSNVCKK